MRIELDFLLNPPSISEQVQAQALALLAQHDLDAEAGRREGWLDELERFLHFPHVWHVEENGWILTGMQSDWPEETPYTQWYVIKEGFGAAINHEAFLAHARHLAARPNPLGLAEALETWLEGETPQGFYQATQAHHLDPTSHSDPSYDRLLSRLRSRKRWEDNQNYYNLSHPNAYFPPLASQKFVAEGRRQHYHPVLTSLFSFNVFDSHLFCPPAHRFPLLFDLLDLFSEQTTHRQLMAFLQQHLIDGLQATHQRLAQCFPTEHWDLVIKTTWPCFNALAWLSMGNRKYRFQALNSGSLALVDLIHFQWGVDATENGDISWSLNHPTTHSDYARFDALSKTIDEGQPWMDQACELLTSAQWTGPLSPAMTQQALRTGLRRFASTPEPDRPHGLCPEWRGWESEPFVATQALWCMGVMEKHHLPQNAEQWKNLSNFLLVLFPAFSNGGDSYFLDYKRYTLPLWKTSAPVSGFPLLTRDIHAKSSEVSPLEEWVKKSLGHRYNLTPYHPQFQRALNTLTLSQWEEFDRPAHAFHEQATERLFQRQAAQPKAEDQWELGMPATFQHGSVTLTGLHTPAQVIDEGRTMQHCVAGYVSYCFSGYSRIYSLLDHRTGERATLDLCQKEQRVVLREIKGHRNQPAAPDLLRAAEAFIDQLPIPSQPWPNLPVPPQWTGKTDLDEQFHAQVLDWFQRHHPNVLELAALALEAPDVD